MCLLALSSSCLSYVFAYLISHQATVTYPTEALRVQGGPIQHNVLVEGYVNMVLNDTSILFVPWTLPRLFACCSENEYIIHILWC